MVLVLLWLLLLWRTLVTLTDTTCLTLTVWKFVSSSVSEVYDVVATATSDSSAVITWGDSSVVDEYLIDWGLAGFTQGTGVYDTIVGTTWSNNMLTAGETYEFYFQSVCSAIGVNSPWYGPVTVDIPCVPTSVPFADGFENNQLLMVTLQIQTYLIVGLTL